MKTIYGEKLPGILKDAQGVPTGRLFGTAATVVDQEMLPQMPPEIIAPAFKKELDEWVAIGVTTLSTRIRGAEITAYGNLDRKGELPLRMAYTHEIGRWNPFFIAKASQERSTQGRRFALDHGMMISPEVIAKSAKVGAIWSLQPQMFYSGTAATVGRMYGEDIGHKWVLPVKSLIDAGVRVTYGADTHDDPDRHPMFGLQILVTRKTEDGRIWGSREKIDRSTGLLMMTRWAAEYVLREKELGSIEVGKLADLTILRGRRYDGTRRQDRPVAYRLHHCGWEGDV